MVRVGDTVRVVLEGTVTYCGNGGGFAVGEAPVRPEWVVVKSVEVIEQPPKVGDTIVGAEAYEALPVGAVVTTTGGTGQMMKTRSGLWVDAISELHGGLIPVAPRVLVYLPETGDSE